MHLQLQQACNCMPAGGAANMSLIFPVAVLMTCRLVEEGTQPRPRVKRKAEHAPEEHQPVRRSRRQAKAKADAEGGAGEQGHEEEPLMSLEDRVSRQVHPAQRKVIIHDKAGRMKSTEDMDEVRAHNLMR